MRPPAQCSVTSELSTLSSQALKTPKDREHSRPGQPRGEKEVFLMSSLYPSSFSLGPFSLSLPKSPAPPSH